MTATITPNGLRCVACNHKTKTPQKTNKNSTQSQRQNQNIGTATTPLPVTSIPPQKSTHLFAHTPALQFCMNEKHLARIAQCLPETTRCQERLILNTYTRTCSVAGKRDCNHVPQAKRGSVGLSNLCVGNKPRLNHFEEPERVVKLIVKVVHGQRINLNLSDNSRQIHVRTTISKLVSFRIKLSNRFARRQCSRIIARSLFLPYVRKTAHSFSERNRRPRGICQSR